MFIIATNPLVQLLHAYERPHLVRIASIGRSHEGRAIWALTLTHFQTGPDHEKPAFYVDGNIHSSELASSAACLYLIHKLTTHYGKDADVTRCLDTRAFYIVPRVNPDGAEWVPADVPKLIRSSTRPYSSSYITKKAVEKKLTRGVIAERERFVLLSIT